MNSQIIERSRHLIWFETTAMLAALALMLSLMGYLLFGLAGLWFGPLSLTMFILVDTKISVRWLIRGYRAIPVARNHPLNHLLVTLLRRLDLPHTVQLFYSPSRQINAFAIGKGDQSAIVLTSGIVTQFSMQEMAGILAHELSHIRNHDIRYLSASVGLTNMIAQLSFVLMVVAILSAPILITEGSFLLLMAMVIAATCLPSMALLLHARLSRTREFAADLSAAELLGTPNYLIAALNRLDRFSSWFVLPWMRHRNRDYDSHPDTRERISRLRSYRQALV